MHRIRLAILLALVPVLSHGAARQPVLPSVDPSVSRQLTWIRNGEPSQLPLAVFDSAAYLSVEQAAEIAQSNLRWQSVSRQACLSNIRGLLCFDWENSAAVRDGKDRGRPIPLRFEKDQLFIPISYVASKEFEAFSGSRLSYDARHARLKQDAPVRIQIPAVEREDGRYTLRIAVPEVFPHYLIEKSPERIWIRFVRGHVEGGSQVLEGDEVIREIRVIQRRHSADLVVTPGAAASANDVYFDDGKRTLVIEVEGKDAPARAPVARSTLSAAPPKAVLKPALPIPVPAVRRPDPPARPAGKKDKRIIVVDAGHGGMDSGAIGTRGTLEKEINLIVAKALAKYLAKETDFEVVTTRDSDDFIALSQRTQIANEAGADLFVSIHCNSSLSSKGSGFETYVLSPEATDRAAEAVARLENSVVALEVEKGESSSRLEQLLASMAVYNFINESSKFAALVCRHVRETAQNNKTAVKEADFFVLRGAQMPAVLVELEYLSNPVSELKLRSSRYRTKLVKGIAEGILAYDRQFRQEREAIASQNRDALNRRTR